MKAQVSRLVSSLLESPRRWWSVEYDPILSGLSPFWQSRAYDALVKAKLEPHLASPEHLKVIKSVLAA